MLNQKSHPKAKRYSVFAYGAKNIEPNKNYTIGYITASSYIKQRFITRKILKTFIKKGWVIVTKGSRTRLSVKEICKEAIDSYLML